MVTLKDVAKYANVSVATVSCTLSGAKNVRHETKTRVLEAISQLGYLPNYAARNLKSQSKSEVGVVLSGIESAYQAELLKGITGTLQNSGMTTNIAFSGGQSYYECKELDRLIGKGVAGIIISSCQPENIEFFKSRLFSNNIPCVFLDQMVHSAENFAGFDNCRTINMLTTKLFSKGYTQLCLIMGRDNLSSEKDSLEGYNTAFKQCKKSFQNSIVLKTNGSKEQAFKATIELLSSTTPSAIIATSKELLEGVYEATTVVGIKTPQELLLLCLGEENWSSKTNIRGVISTARAAFKLGEEACLLLLQNMQNLNHFEKKQLLKTDNILDDGVYIPFNKAKKSETTAETKSSIKVLAVELTGANAIWKLSENLQLLYGISLDITYCEQGEMLKAIVADCSASISKYDVYMFDNPWTRYLHSNNYLLDIQDFVHSKDFKVENFLQNTLDGCKADGRYCGIPLVGASQILFYRKDLFEDLQIQKQYKAKYGCSLKPPTTFAEFLRISEFFTEKYNKYSKTKYGTSICAKSNDELTPELLTRLFAVGAQLFDSNSSPTINTKEFLKALRILKENLLYIEKSPFETGVKDALNDFRNGKTAMLISYSIYASYIAAEQSSKVIGRVGYSFVPGKTPINCGWNLGINPKTQKQAEIFTLFKWLCRKDISYYLTIVDGESPCVHPYSNNELLRLYPWMKQSFLSTSLSKRRSSPRKKGYSVIPQNLLEDIICDAFKNLVNGDESAEIAQVAQTEMENLFKSYNYL